MIKNKLKLVLVAILYVFQTVNSQSKTYYDKDWKTTTKDKAVYYRLLTKKNDSLFYMKDYYINGALQMEGHISSLEEAIFEGEIIWYTPEGKKQNSANYKKGVLHGLHTVYLKNGKVDYTTEYKNGKVYEGEYLGGYYRQYYKKGELIKEVEFEAPNNFRNLRTRVYGVEKDTVYWMSNKGDKLVGIGIYDSGSNDIIDGLKIKNNWLISVHTNYKNRKREGFQKVFYEGEFLTEQTFVNDIVVLERSINPLNGKTVEINFKNGEPYTGHLFQFDDYSEDYNEFIYEKGVVLVHNYYEKIEGKLKLNPVKSYKLGD